MELFKYILLYFNKTTVNHSKRTGLSRCIITLPLISVRNYFQNHRYFSVTDQTLEETGYSKTYPGEPNGGTDENCGMINKNSLLGNGFCHAPVAFICEINLYH